MEQDVKWGGINIRYLFRYLKSNLWMAIVTGIIFFLIGSIMSERSHWTTYKTSAIVSVTGNSMPPLPENLEYRVQFANSAIAVLSSDPFITGAKADSGIRDVSVSAELVEKTNLVTVSCSSDNPDSAYIFLNYLIENFDSISSYVSGDLFFSVIQYPKMPRDGIDEAATLPHPALLAVAGIAMVLFVFCCLYAFPITYKGTGIIFKEFGDDILQVIPYVDGKQTQEERMDDDNNVSPAKKRTFFRKKHSENRKVNKNNSKKISRREKKRTNQIAIANNEFQKLFFLIKQHIQKKDKKILLFTSAEANEGKHTICNRLVRELEESGMDIFYLEGTLMSVISKDSVTEDMVVQDESLGCDKIKTSSVPKTYSYESVRSLINEMRTKKDAVIICGVSGADDVTVSLLAEIADETFLIIRENTADIRKIDSLYNKLKYTSQNLGGCILNAFY